MTDRDIITTITQLLKGLSKVFYGTEYDYYLGTDKLYNEDYSKSFPIIFGRFRYNNHTYFIQSNPFIENMFNFVDDKNILSLDISTVSKEDLEYRLICAIYEDIN